MPLDELKPGNTKKAKDTARKAFLKFLQDEDVALDYMRSCILGDSSGRTFVSVMDKFGMYLAFKEGPNGQPLARNTAMQYYRQAKLWLLELFPQQRVMLESRLLEMGRTLDNFCSKRDGGSFVNKAPGCTKTDLRKLTCYLYTHACSSSDYQDAALLCLLWYLFGRASDLTLVRKQNLSIDAGGVFFLCFVRVKTSEEQGLALFSDDCDFLTCQLHAIVCALITQAAPCPQLIDNLQSQQIQTIVTLSPATPLIDLLDNPTVETKLESSSRTSAASSPTIITHVNSILRRTAKLAGVEEALTSHSFRREGAQHANGHAELTSRWIFDRGAWNMTTTNKGFNYVFNTSREDHKVAKLLSGRTATAEVALLDLAQFDVLTQERIVSVQRKLFVSAVDLGTQAHNVNHRVLDVLTAYLIRSYPLLKKLHPDGLAVTRLEASVIASHCSLVELLSWSMHLSSRSVTCREEAATAIKPHDATAKTQEHTIIQHQASVIDHLIQAAKRQEERMGQLEAKLNQEEELQAQKRQTQDADVSIPKKRKTAAPVTHLRAVWFAWYAQEPPLWHAQGQRQKKSDSKLLVAFMKLFLKSGFALAPRAPCYRDDVYRIGVEAVEGVLAFLAARGIRSKGANAVLKILSVLHREGTLNSKIDSYRQLLRSARFTDPAPGYTQDILESM